MLAFNTGSKPLQALQQGAYCLMDCICPLFLGLAQARGLVPGT
jgi:hypothetical protein